MNSDYCFVDTTKARTCSHHWNHPPPLNLITANLKPGYYVKVGVYNPLSRENEFWSPGERFWCQVIEVAGLDIHVVVTQDMAATPFHGIRDQDRLVVRRMNILGILDKDMNSIWEAPLMGSTGPSGFHL